MNQYIIIAIVWATSLVGVGAWQNQAGHTAERVEWQAREVTELTAANLAISTLQDAYREAERVYGATLSTIATNYEGKLSNANNQRAVDLTAIRAGTLRLRDPDAASEDTCRNPMPGVAAGAGLGNGQAGGGLSQRATEFLFGRAGLADTIVEQLAACQAIVIADRAVTTDQ